MSEIKYEDQYLTLVQYKEPLRKVKTGFGYEGCLLSTMDGSKVQCHMCGKLFGELGAHIHQAHGINVKEYKEKFSLAPSTSLISEDIRQARKARTLEWIKKMEQKHGLGWRKHFIEIGRKGQKKRSKGQPVLSLEDKNKRGTCPDQLLQKIKEVADILGHTPSKRQFIVTTGTQRYVHLIYKTFGSWRAALKKLRMKPQNSSPKGNNKVRYTDQALLDHLLIFYETNKKPPTETDARRGLIPSTFVYRRRFGSLPKAREMVGIMEKPSKWSNKNFGLELIK